MGDPFRFTFGNDGNPTGSGQEDGGAAGHTQSPGGSGKPGEGAGNGGGQPGSASGAGNRKNDAEETDRKRREEAQKRRESSIKGYQAFLKHTANLEKWQPQRDALRSQAQAADRKKNEYAALWDECINNAYKAAARKDQSRRVEGDRKRQELRDQTDREKLGRKNRLEQQREKYNKAIREQQAIQAELEKKRQAVLKRIDGLGSLKVPDSDCDRGTQIFLQDALKNGYLSASQNKMLKLPAEEFREKWASSLSEFKQLEKGYLSTAFCKYIKSFEPGEAGFKKLKNKVQFVFTVILLLIGLFCNVTKNDMSGKILIFFLEWLIAFLVSGLILKAVRAVLSKSRRKFEDSRLSIVSAGFGLFWAAIDFGEVGWRPIFNKGLPVCIAACIVTGFLPRRLMNVYGINTLFRNTSSGRKLEYREAFGNADSYEKQAKDEYAVMPGEIDAMIVCYLRHEELMEYYNEAYRSQEKEKLNKELQSLKLLGQQAREDEESQRKNLEKLKDLQNSNSRADAESDERLRQELARIDREYGGSSAMDYRLRKNLLPDDRRRLEEKEKYFGLTAAQTALSVEAIEAAGAVILKRRESLDKAEQSIAKTIETIRKWYSRDYTTPLETGGRLPDGKPAYSYTLPPYICLDMWEKDGREPQIIRHNGQPLVISCPVGRNSPADITGLVRELWMAFYKGVPQRLERMALVDPERYLEMEYNAGGTARPLFRRHVTAGLAPAGDDKISCLFERDQIGRLDQELRQQITVYRDYSTRYSDNMSKAPAGVGEFEQVNYCRLHIPATPDPLPYYIVMIIVPSQGFTGKPADWISAMLNLIQNNNCRRDGLLPVVITREGDIAQNWKEQLTDRAASNGTTYRLEPAALVKA